MSEQSAAEALRSDAPLVVVEAPAGCGKTFQAAAFAGDCAATLGLGRMLILTHTHAACGVIAKRVTNGQHADIRTIDSLIVQIGNAYHRTLDLRADVSAWTSSSADRRTSPVCSRDDTRSCCATSIRIRACTSTGW